MRQVQATRRFLFHGRLRHRREPNWCVSWWQAPPRHVVCIDNNETELFFQLEHHQRLGQGRRGYLADIRDREVTEAQDARRRYRAPCRRAQACRPVRGQPRTRRSQTNIQGTQNVIDAAQENGVERVIFTSSDKAVNPTNVMGTSKLMGERLMTAAAETTANGA